MKETECPPHVVVECAECPALVCLKCGVHAAAPYSDESEVEVTEMCPTLRDTWLLPLMRS